MRAYQKERLLSHLKRLRAVVDAYASHDPGFADKVIEWLDEAEDVMARLQFPQGARMSSLRASILAAGDRRVVRDGKHDYSLVRRSRNVAAADAIENAESIMREQLLVTDAFMEPFRTKLVEMTTGATLLGILPPRKSQPYEAWLSLVWQAMASHEKTRGTATYLANSLAASDRLYLLDDVVSRLTSRLLPVIDLGLMDVDDSAEAKSAEPLNAEEFVQFLNEATPRELRNAGLDWQQGQALIAQRPHVDTEELSQTLGLGADFFDDLRIGAAGWKKGAEVSGLYLTADEVVRVLDLVHRASTVHMIEVVCLPQELAIRIEQTRPFGGIQALASLPGINFSIISALLSFVNDWLPRTRVQDVVLSRPETRDILLVVNLASLKQLETEAGLPHEALEHLREHRPISSIDELLAVPGIGRHVLARLLLLSRTWEPAPPAPPAPSALPQAPLGDNEP